MFRFCVTNYSLYKMGKNPKSKYTSADQVFIEISDGDAKNSDSEMSTSESNSDNDETSEDPDSKLHAEVYFALASEDLSVVTEKVKKLPVEQRLSLGVKTWTNLKLLQLLLPWSEFMDLALHDPNLNHKLSTPQEVIQAAFVLMNRGAHLISRVPPRPNDKQSMRSGGPRGRPPLK